MSVPVDCPSNSVLEVTNDKEETTELFIVSSKVGCDNEGNVLNIISFDDITRVATEPIPEVIAAETVVTTTPGGNKRKQNIKQIRRHLSDTKDIEGATEADWNLDLGISNDCDGVLTTVQEPYVVAVVQDCETVEKNTSGGVKTLQEMAKRERDRMRKQELRKNPFVRQRERDKARSRMKLKRQEPGYRQVERERDKVRRRIARLTNPEKRAEERQADKQRKREQRKVAVTVNDMYSVLPLTSESCTYVLDIPQSTSFASCDSLTNSVADDT